jgi:drug/metabolite transporter (DMT)-like permease
MTGIAEARLYGHLEQRSAHSGYHLESFYGRPMSSFALYVVGFIVLVGGLIYGAYLIHIPHTWIIVGALVFVGLGIMSAVSRTKRRDPPAEAPRAPDA